MLRRCLILIVSVMLILITPGPRGLQEVSLTPEEFKEMIPWYDLSLEPLPDHELIKIDHVTTYAFSRFTLTYVTDTKHQIQVMIYGDQEKLAQTHGPSEFDLLLRISFSDISLEPAIDSRRTKVIVGFLGPIDRSDGNIFLRNVVLHPTLQ